MPWRDGFIPGRSGSGCIAWALTAPACQVGHGNNTLSLRVGGDVGVTLHDSPHTRFVVSGCLASLEANLSDGSVSAVEIASLDISIQWVGKCCDRMVGACLAGRRVRRYTAYRQGGRPRTRSPRLYPTMRHCRLMAARLSL
ncbi:MAG: hypothetical protein AAYR33_08325 [Acetobacteraceae bacterium]